MTVQIDTTAEIDGVRLREQGGDPTTPAASHWILYAKSTGLFIEDDASAVTGPLGAGGGGSSIGTGSVASLPSPGTSGDVYLPNNGVQLYRSTGAAQVPWGPLYPFADPSLQTWAWINQGGASVDATKGGIFLTVPIDASAYNWRIRKKALPAAPYTVTLAFVPTWTNSSNKFALCLRESGSGKLEAMVMGDYALSITDYSSPTAFAATPSSFGGCASQVALLFMQVSDDNAGNRTWRYSTDGVHFMQIYTAGSTSYLTPDEIGFMGDEHGGIFDCGMLVYSWLEA